MQPRSDSGSAISTSARLGKLKFEFVGYVKISRWWLQLMAKMLSCNHIRWSFKAGPFQMQPSECPRHNCLSVLPSDAYLLTYRAQPAYHPPYPPYPPGLGGVTAAQLLVRLHVLPVLTVLVTLLSCLVITLVSGHGVLVTTVVGTMVVSVHSLGVAVVNGKVDVSVQVEMLKVGIFVVRVWHVTVVVVWVLGTDLV